MSLAFCVYDGYICFATDVDFNIEYDTQTLNTVHNHSSMGLNTTESEVSGSMNLYTKYEEVLDGPRAKEAYIDFPDTKIFLDNIMITNASVNPEYEKVISYYVEWIASDVTIKEKNNE